MAWAFGRALWGFTVVTACAQVGTAAALRRDPQLGGVALAALFLFSGGGPLLPTRLDASIYGTSTAPTRLRPRLQVHPGDGRRGPLARRMRNRLDLAVVERVVRNFTTRLSAHTGARMLDSDLIAQAEKLRGGGSARAAGSGRALYRVSQFRGLFEHAHGTTTMCLSRRRRASWRMGAGVPQERLPAPPRSMNTTTAYRIIAE